MWKLNKFGEWVFQDGAYTVVAWSMLSGRWNAWVVINGAEAYIEKGFESLSDAMIAGYLAMEADKAENDKIRLALGV